MPREGAFQGGCFASPASRRGGVGGGSGGGGGGGGVESLSGQGAHRGSHASIHNYLHKIRRAMLVQLQVLAAMQSCTALCATSLPPTPRHCRH